MLSLQYLELDENHCGVLGAYSRPGLKIELSNFRIADAAAEALAPVLGRNQGLTSYYVLANGLRGNSRLKSLATPIVSNSKREALALAGALKKTEVLLT